MGPVNYAGYLFDMEILIYFKIFLVAVNSKNKLKTKPEAPIAS